MIESSLVPVFCTKNVVREGSNGTTLEMKGKRGKNGGKDGLFVKMNVLTMR